MMQKPKLTICECCGQIISKYPTDVVEKQLRIIESLYGLSLKDIKNHDKRPEIVQARQHFWFLLCVEDSWSFPRLGKKTGHDHTTVIYGVKMFAHYLLGTPKRSSLRAIIKAYWLAAGMSEEFANEKANKKTQGRR
jgi:hypothetical protein